MTREEALVILDGFKNNPLFSDTHAQALDMAIASLKTDEVYQLEYENRDFVEIHKGMTNGEVIQALFPNMTIAHKSSNGVLIVVENLDSPYPHEFYTEWWNAPYQKGGESE